MTLAEGQTIKDGKYRILRIIGEGGMARVWLAEELTFGGRVVAIKEPRIDLSPDEARDIQRRYQREVRVCAALEKARVPGVVRAITTEPFEGNLLLAMEYMPGGDLAGVLKQQPDGMPVDRAVAIALDVLAALRGAHRHQMEIVHRDVKPSNILLDAGGKAYLGDFGLAQIANASQELTHLQGSQVPGTPLYASPEQATSIGYLTPATDLYSLGCVLFEMLTGQRYKHLRPGTRCRSLRTQVPRRLDDVVAKALAEQPWERWQSAEDMSAALQSALDKEKIGLLIPVIGHKDRGAASSPPETRNPGGVRQPPETNGIEGARQESGKVGNPGERSRLRAEQVARQKAEQDELALHFDDALAALRRVRLARGRRDNWSFEDVSPALVKLEQVLKKQPNYERGGRRASEILDRAVRNTLGELNYGWLLHRAIAQIIDLCLLAVPLLSFLAAVPPPLGFGDASRNLGVGDPNNARLLAMVPGYLLIVLVAWLYHAWMESSPRQATLGKILTGMVVTDLALGRISMARATSRFLVKFGLLSVWVGTLVQYADSGGRNWTWLSFLLMSGIGLTSVWLSGGHEKAQAIHDVIAGTVVLRDA